MESAPAGRARRPSLRVRSWRVAEGRHHYRGVSGDAGVGASWFREASLVSTSAAGSCNAEHFAGGTSQSGGRFVRGEDERRTVSGRVRVVPLPVAAEPPRFHCAPC